MSNLSDPKTARLGQLASPSRNRHFYGKLLDVDHLDLEQEYGIRQRWLLNRLTLGAGVVRGLKIAPTADGTGIVVGPGVAIDQYGREIVVPGPSPAIDPRQPTDDGGRPDGDRLTGSKKVSLWLAYRECLSEPTPVLVGPCGDSHDCEPALICERFALLVREQIPESAALKCGLTTFQKTPLDPNTLSQEVATRLAETTAEVKGDGAIPLAVITLPADGSSDTMTIDTTVAPLVYGNPLLAELLTCVGNHGALQQAPPAPLQPTPQPTPTPSPVDASEFTTIESVNWEYKNTFTLVSLLRGLEVGFSNPIQPMGPDHNVWFRVDLEYPVAPDFSRIDSIWPATVFCQRILAKSIDVDVTARRVRFLPDNTFLSTFQKVCQQLKLKKDHPVLCRVTINCSCLQGPNEKPYVDGTYFPWKTDPFPTGCGVRGSQFESCFFLPANPG